MQTSTNTKPKILAYLRVSTDKQDLNSQRLAILNYAHRNKLKVKDFIEAQTSSRSSFKERMIDTLLEQLKPEDTLIVRYPLCKSTYAIS